MQTDDQSKSLMIPSVVEDIARKDLLTHIDLNKLLNIYVVDNDNYVVHINKDISFIFDNLEVISKNISFDGNTIHLNGRNGKLLKNRPESKKYIDEINNQQKSITCEKLNEFEIITSVLSELEEKILGTTKIKKLVEGKKRNEV